MTSLPPCWWTKIKDLSLSSFVRPPEVVHFSIVIGVSRSWLKTSYSDWPGIGKYSGSRSQNATLKYSFESI